MPKRLATPHPSPLPQGARGWLPWCNALRLLHPTPLPLGGGDGYRGRLRFANRPCLSRGRRKPHRGWNPRPLPRRGMPGWHPPRTGKPAKFRRCRPWLSLPQCAADPGLGKGANGHPLPSYGAEGARSMDIADSSVRIDRFFALVQSYGPTPGVVRGHRPWWGARQSVNGVVFPRSTPFSHLSGVPRVG